MEIAVNRSNSEVLAILSEFTEITDRVKLLQMLYLIYNDKPKKSKEKFQSILETLPVDLVRISFGSIFTEDFSFVSSDRSSYSDDDLLHIRSSGHFFRFSLSP